MPTDLDELNKLVKAYDSCTVPAPIQWDLESHVQGGTVLDSTIFYTFPATTSTIYIKAPKFNTTIKKLEVPPEAELDPGPCKCNRCMPKKGFHVTFGEPLHEPDDDYWDDDDDDDPQEGN